MREGLHLYAKHCSNHDYLDRELESLFAYLSDDDLVKKAKELGSRENAGQTARWIGKVMQVACMREWSRRHMSCRSCSWVGPTKEGLCEHCVGEPDASSESP